MLWFRRPCYMIKSIHHIHTAAPPTVLCFRASTCWYLSPSSSPTQKERVIGYLLKCLVQRLFYSIKLALPFRSFLPSQQFTSMFVSLFSPFPSFCLHSRFLSCSYRYFCFFFSHCTSYSFLLLFLTLGFTSILNLFFYFLWSLTRFTFLSTNLPFILF